MALAPTDVLAFETDLRQQLRYVYSAHRWLLAHEVVQGSVERAQQLLLAGAPEVMPIGVAMGVGPIDDSLTYLSLGQETSASMNDFIRAANAVLRDPPTSALRAVDSFDPDASARAMVNFTIGAGVICGRATFGARPVAWEQLEDKLLIAEVWAAAGIQTAAAVEVALADGEAAVSAHRRLATEQGTVWAVDNREGWHGGGGGTHWVLDIAQAESLTEALAARHERIRVMPFVEGTPCSVHGMVIGETTIAFRPMELMIYRDRALRSLVYAKAASFWDPDAADREAMRTAAVRVGAELRSRVGFQGVFTLDGIMSAVGFVPTEVNTRFGGALPVAIKTTEGDPISLFLIHLAVIEGVIDVDPGLLEAWVVDKLDATRYCAGLFETVDAPDVERSMNVRWGGAGELVTFEFEPGVEHDPTTLATITWGSRGPQGVMFIRGTSQFPVGPPSAPLVLEIAELVDSEWDVGLPRMEAATDVRPVADFAHDSL